MREYIASFTTGAKVAIGLGVGIVVAAMVIAIYWYNNFAI